MKKNAASLHFFNWAMLMYVSFRAFFIGNPFEQDQWVLDVFVVVNDGHGVWLSGVLWESQLSLWANLWPLAQCFVACSQKWHFWALVIKTLDASILIKRLFSRATQHVQLKKKERLRRLWPFLESAVCFSDRKMGWDGRGEREERRKKWKKSDYISPVEGIQRDHYYSLN